MVNTPVPGSFCGDLVQCPSSLRSIRGVTFESPPLPLDHTDGTVHSA